MTKETPCILVVDDEFRYVETIKLNLEARGYEVVTARDGQEAVELAAKKTLLSFSWIFVCAGRQLKVESRNIETTASHV